MKGSRGRDSTSSGKGRGGEVGKPPWGLLSPGRAQARVAAVVLRRRHCGDGRVEGLLAWGRRPENGKDARRREIDASPLKPLSSCDVGPRRANRRRGVYWGQVFIGGAVRGENAW